MGKDTKLPELVSVGSATAVCKALYTSLLGIETIEAPADCHIAANVGPAERTFRPLMSSGLRMQPFFEAMAPASQASARTITPAFSICALISFMNGELFTRCARSWLRTRPGISVAPNARTLPLA